MPRPSTLPLLALAALVAAAPACRYVANLDPAMSLSVDAGICGWHVIIDQRRALWKEQGCEDGRPLARRVRRISAGERATLAAAIARLPAESPQITAEEFAPVVAAFTAITSHPEIPCHLEPTVLGPSADGTTRSWTLEVCPDTKIHRPANAPPAAP